MILLTDEEIDEIYAEWLDTAGKLSKELVPIVAKAQLKKVEAPIDEVIRLLGKVVPHDKNAMIEWAVKSQDSVYTNAGAAYRILLEFRQALLEEIK